MLVVSDIHRNGCMHHYCTTYQRMTSAMFPKINLVTYHGPMKKGALETKQTVAETGNSRGENGEKGVKPADVVCLIHAQTKCDCVYTIHASNRKFK